MIVVSNTSPLTNLAAIGQFHLLQELYGQIHIADGVWAELNARGRAWPGSQQVASSPWVIRQTVQNHALVTSLQRDLDRGELETIALAVELQANLVLLDEKDGRQMAQRFGLNMVGVLGVLLEAKKKNLVGELRPQLDALRQSAGFYLSDKVYRQVLRLAGE